jgi:hypothetical protein
MTWPTSKKPWRTTFVASWVPAGHTEQSVMAIIDEVVGVLAPRFVFGFYGLDDVKQEGRREAFELLSKGTYDPARPLASYIYVHVRNRLSNIRRNRFHRADSPCARCNNSTPCGADGDFCKSHKNWKKRNSAKANLQRTLSIDHIRVETEKTTQVNRTPAANAEHQDLLDRIDVALPLELRSAYLRMLAGDKGVIKHDRLAVEKAVRSILKYDGLDEDDLRN